MTTANKVKQLIGQIEEESLSCDYNDTPVVQSDIAINMLIELQSFNNSCICENCEHFNYDDDISTGYCEAGVNDGTDSTNYQVAEGNVVESDFGCNQFYPKDVK